MKKTMIILCAVLMLCACGGDHKEKTYSREENVEYLCALAHASPDDLKYLSDGRIDTIADEFRKLNMKMSTYTSMKAIWEELDAVWQLSDDNIPFNDVHLEVALSRTEFHLNNPITWREYKSTEDYNPLKVFTTPDEKYKFYTTYDICRGSAGDFMTYYQFEEDGKMMCKLFEGRNDDYWQHSNVRDVWQFDYHDSTFYVLKGIYQEAGCVWRYSLDIVSFERNGALKYHDRFIPNDRKDVYDIAWTYSCLPVGYVFDPETLTVTARTQEGDSLVTKTWKLKLD